jgi:Ca2+-transporting ATPase
MGRRIYDNLKKAIAYIFSIHIPIAGMSILPVLFGWPLILLPLHVVFLELIIDPTCSVVFEGEQEEANVMKRKPYSVNKRLFNKEAAIAAFLQGFVALVIVILIFVVSLDRGLGENTARTMAFSTIVTANLALILTNRSWAHTIIGTLRKRNNAFWWIIGMALLALALVIYIPQLSRLFSFIPLDPVNLLICIGAGLASIIWFEIYKGAKIIISSKNSKTLA